MTTMMMMVSPESSSCSKAQAQRSGARAKLAQKGMCCALAAACRRLGNGPRSVAQSLTTSHIHDVMGVSLCETCSHPIGFSGLLRGRQTCVPMQEARCALPCAPQRGCGVSTCVPLWPLYSQVCSIAAGACSFTATGARRASALHLSCAWRLRIAVSSLHQRRSAERFGWLRSLSDVARAVRMDNEHRCKFCRRGKQHLNPNRKQAEKDATKQYLQWARAGGRECAPCRSHIKSQFPDFVDQKGALQQNIRDSDEFRKKYDESLKRWEEAYFTQGQRSRPNAGNGRSVEAANVSMLQTTQCIGNLWPKRVYEAHFKKSAPKQLTTVMHCGQQVRGVVLDPSAGWSQGVIKLDTVGQSVVKNTQTFEVDEGIREGGVQEVYAEAAKQIAGVTARKRKRGKDDDPDEPEAYIVQASLTNKSKSKGADD